MHACVHVFVCVCVCVCVLSCVRLCNPMECRVPGTSVHGIFQSRILDWIVISSSRGCTWPRDWSHVSHVSCTGRWIFFTTVPPGEALLLRTVFCKWRKLHRDHFYYWSVSFKTHKNFTQYWLYLEIKITYKNSSDFYFIPCGDLWFTTQCLNAIYSLRELTDTTSANRSLFWLNLKDFFFFWEPTEKMILKERIYERGERSFQILKISHSFYIYAEKKLWITAHQILHQVRVE